MQPLQNSRIDVGDLKAQIVKKLGPESAKRYFYYLNRLLSQKLSKIEFDKLCFRVLGRENLPLHNQLIRSILKNACVAKTPPFPVHDAGPTRISTCTEDDHERGGSIVPNRKSNGVLTPMSPRKGRSTIRERTLRDRPSPLGPNGKADSHQSTGTEDSGLNTALENGTLTPCDYQRPVREPDGVAEQPDNRRPGLKKSTNALVCQLGEDQLAVALVEDRDKTEQGENMNITRRPLLAPLGIPFCSASVGGARKGLPVASSSGDVSYFDSEGLSDTETLRKYMEQIATAQGLGGVSMDCANILNNMLDVYLKQLIRSCIELVGARSANGPKKNTSNKEQLQGKIINGMWPSNHPHIQNTGGVGDFMPEQNHHSSLSLLDFKVAMELNPQQLGEDWPLLLEKICMRWFEE